MGAPTFRSLMKGYWKSPFGKSFRKAGYPWVYFGDSVQGYVRAYYRRRHRIPVLDSVPAYVQPVAEKLENLIRRVHAESGNETKRRKAEAERATARAEANAEAARHREPRLEGFQQDGHPT